jgi:Transposase IS116/IS110/IS902 family
MPRDQLRCENGSVNRLAGRHQCRESARMLSRRPRLARFRSADALVAAAGLAPLLRQSGRVRFRLRPSGSTRQPFQPSYPKAA